MMGCRFLVASVLFPEAEGWNQGTVPHSDLLGIEVWFGERSVKYCTDQEQKKPLSIIIVVCKLVMWVVY
jgi:hypothetical protein